MTLRISVEVFLECSVKKGKFNIFEFQNLNSFLSNFYELLKTIEEF